METDTTPTYPAGWHADPTGRALQRYWDGSTWTDHIVDRTGVQRREGDVPAAPVMAAASSHAHVTQSTVIMTAPKSRGVAFILTFLFGPLGMIYSTVPGALVMFVLSAVLIPVTLGLAAFVLWPACMIWGVLACGPGTTAVSVNSSLASVQQY